MSRRRVAAPSEPAARTFRRPLLIGLGVVTAFLATVGIGQALPSQGPTAMPEVETTASPSASGAAATEELPFVRRDPSDPLAAGDVDAPVVLSMWTDLRCPYCGVFARDTLPAILDGHVADGSVRIELHDVAFFGEESEDAAVAALAAGRQGRHLEFIRAVYADAPESGHAELPRAALLGFAETAGVADLAAFESDLDDAALRDEVRRGTLEAQQLGISSVPFFVAGDAALAGAQPLEAFQQLLDAELAQAR